MSAVPPCTKFQHRTCLKTDSTVCGYRFVRSLSEKTPEKERSWWQTPIEQRPCVVCWLLFSIQIYKSHILLGYKGGSSNHTALILTRTVLSVHQQWAVHLSGVPASDYHCVNGPVCHNSLSQDLISTQIAQSRDGNLIKPRPGNWYWTGLQSNIQLLKERGYKG